MNRDHMKAWRDYFVAEMHERFGIENDEARKTVANWLRSLGRVSTTDLALPYEVPRNRRQRQPTSRSMRSGTARASRA
jgi:hypothetical protein